MRHPTIRQALPRYRVVIALAVLISVPRPTSAQDTDWTRELEARVRARAHRIGEAVLGGIGNLEERAWLRDMARDIARDVEAQVRSGRRAEARRSEQATENVSRTARLGRSGVFDLQNVSGDVVITGGSGDSVRIDAVKRARGRTPADAQARLADIRVEVTERTDRVEVRTEYPERGRGIGSVDYTVTVPSGAGVTVRSVSGNVRVTNVDGELRMQSVSGNLTASSVKGVSRVRSVSGNVEITKAEGTEVTGGTVSGDVVLTDVRSRGVELQTVSGDMRFVDAEVDRASLRSVSGDIEFAGRLTRNGRYEMQSHSGDVRLTPRGDRGFELEAGTFSGDVRSDFELKVQGLGEGRAAPDPRMRGRDLRRGLGRGQRIRGVAGDGGAMLSLRSFSGDIVVTR